MPIKSNNPVIKDIGTGDTTILNPIDGRAALSFANVKNNGSIQVTVEAWKSPDPTSINGSAERIYSKVLAAGEEDTAFSLLTTVPMGFYLVMKASATDSIVDISYTQYSGDD